MTDSAVVMTDVKPIQPAVSNKSGTTIRGHKLFTETWLPFSGESKAILMWHIGHGEHIGRYEHVFAYLAAAGIAVHSYDCFGHGRSEPKEKDLRCYIPDFNLLVDDYLTRLQQLKDEYTKQGVAMPPVYAGGQSMGGMVVAMAVGRSQQDFAGLVLHSPMIDMEWNLVLRVQASMGALLNALFPKAALVPAVKPEFLSQDPKVVKEYLDDKLNYVGNSKCRTAYVCLQAMKSLHKITPSIAVPVYIAHGSKDKITSANASKQFYNDVSSKDKTYNLVEGGFHELLFGPEKADCLHKLKSWLEEHVKASSGTGDSSAVGAGAASTAAVVAQAQAIVNQTAEVIKDLKVETKAATADASKAAGGVAGKATETAKAAATETKAAAAGATKAATDGAKAVTEGVAKAASEATAAASAAAKE